MEEEQCYVCGVLTDSYCESCGAGLCQHCNSMEKAGICQDCSDENLEEE